MVWMTSAFCYYLINFEMKDLPGSININSMVSYASEITSYALVGFLIKKLMAKWTFAILLLISTISGLCMIMFGFNSDPDWKFYLMVMFAKFGVAGVFTAVYIGHSRMFPVLFSISSCGFCNIVARVAAFFAPEVAEVE